MSKNYGVIHGAVFLGSALIFPTITFVGGYFFRKESDDSGEDVQSDEIVMAIAGEGEYGAPMVDSDGDQDPAIGPEILIQPYFLPNPVPNAQVMEAQGSFTEALWKVKGVHVMDPSRRVNDYIIKVLQENAVAAQQARQAYSVTIESILLARSSPESELYNLKHLNEMNPFLVAQNALRVIMPVQVVSRRDINRSWVIMPCAPGVSIIAFLRDRRNDADASNVLADFGRRLRKFHKFMHGAHNDLNANNVFYDKETGVFSLIDVQSMNFSYDEVCKQDLLFDVFIFRPEFIAVLYKKLGEDAEFRQEFSGIVQELDMGFELDQYRNSQAFTDYFYRLCRHNESIRFLRPYRALMRRKDFVEQSLAAVPQPLKDKMFEEYLFIEDVKKFADSIGMLAFSPEGKERLHPVIHNFLVNYVSEIDDSESFVSQMIMSHTNSYPLF
ncbi:MAG: hypothetical protein H6850_01470 [Alphaproteobacteria bacterium]|nr:MAG: hypothetical protein H6850_01470 [Alphaproteobacteria bacterium]